MLLLTYHVFANRLPHRVLCMPCATPQHQSQHTVDSGTTQLLRAALKAERHPFNPRSSLLVCGTNTGALSVWEVPDAGEPRKLGHFNSSDGTALVGAGIISVRM